MSVYNDRRRTWLDSLRGQQSPSLRPSIGNQGSPDLSTRPKLYYLTMCKALATLAGIVGSKQPSL